MEEDTNVARIECVANSTLCGIVHSARVAVGAQ